MSDVRQTRRRFLLATVSLGAVSTLAGCQTGSKVPLEPHLPASTLDSTGWRKVGDIDDELSEEVDVSGTTQQIDVELKADLYEQNRLVKRLSERFEVHVSDTNLPTAGFVAAKARIDPPVTHVFALSDSILTMAMDALETKAKRHLREQGLRNIRRVDDGRLAVETGGKAPHRRYQADYPYDSFEVNFRGRPITVDGGVFTVEAQIAAWPYAGLLATGAGTYPGESGEITVTARGITQEISLGLDPDQYREEVRRLTRVIS